MNSSSENSPAAKKVKLLLKKKIHRALVEARIALYEGKEAEARQIVRKIMSEAAPAARKASKESGFNWVVEELRPLDLLFLPDE